MLMLREADFELDSLEVEKRLETLRENDDYIRNY